MSDNRPILDKLSASVLAGYTLRRVKSGQPNPARVRESSGGTEIDVGLSGNDWDLAAIAAHCGANSGTIPIWYDVNGTNDATQSTLANQPTTYSSGSQLVNANGTPRLNFDGVNGSLQVASLSGSLPLWFSVVAKFAVGGANRVCFDSQGMGELRKNAINQLALLSGGTMTTASAYGGALHQFDVFVINPGTSEIYVDDVLDASASLGAAGISGKFAIGSRIDALGRFWNGDICEVFIIPSPFADDKTLVRSSQRQHWGTP